MKLSVIIPSKNGIHHLQDCLPSVLKAVKNLEQPAEVIIVDDNSTDNTFEEITHRFSEVKCVKNPKKGICSARNYGVLHSKGDWLVFLDNDVFLEDTFFQTLIKHIHPNIFCIACAGYPAFPAFKGQQLDGIKLLTWRRGVPRFTHNILNKQLEASSEYPSWGVQGAYFACKRDKFEKLNGFDEILDPYMLEESDFAYRGLKRGWRIVYAQDTRPKHKCGGTINSKKNKYSQYLSKRNCILFVWKNIHSYPLLISNICWMLLKPNFKLWKECLALLPQINKRRALEKKEAVVSDKTIFNSVHDFMHSLRLADTAKGNKS